MFSSLLNFGSGTQAVHYLLFCFVAILGTLQGVATRYHLRNLMWFGGRVGWVFAGLTVGGSFIWFFMTDEEIFIPGLAGGELFTIFAIAFLAAIPVTRVIALVSMRVRAIKLAVGRSNGEKEPLL